MGCGTGGLTAVLADRVGVDGKILALDPDERRLELALLEHAKVNIEWSHTKIGDFVQPRDLFDAAFSNYVLHWLDSSAQAEAMARVYQCLRPGGHFGFTVIAKVPEVVQGITRLIGSEADALLQCFHAPTLADWQGSLQKAGFRLERAEKVILEVNYGPLEDFFDWWVGTSHGVFSPGKIEASDRAVLRKMFPGDLLVDHPVLRFVAVK